MGTKSSASGMVKLCVMHGRHGGVEPLRLTPKGKGPAPRGKSRPKVIPLMPEADVVAAVATLQTRTDRTGFVGRQNVPLPGPCTVDIVRHLQCYEAQVYPVLRDLVTRGVLALQKIGSYRCYRTAELAL